MIEFEAPIEEPKFLRRVVLWARRNRDSIPSLSDLARKRSVADLTALAKLWQQAGLGQMIEVSEDGRRSVLFSLSDDALKSVDATYRKSLVGRLLSVPKGDWIALGSFLVSCAALFVAILAYLKA